MVKPHLRSSSIKKVSNKKRTLYKRKKKHKVKDSNGIHLSYASHKGSKTQKTTTRVFGNTYYHKTTELIHRYAARLKSGFIKLEQVPNSIKHVVSNLVKKL